MKVGEQVTGWVAAVKPFGIIMNFTGNVRGLVHNSQISNVPLSVEQIEGMYKLGQVISTTTDNILVQLSTGEQADLPAGHLTDFPSLEQPLLLLAPGSSFPKVLVLSKRQKKIIVTTKPSLLGWMESNPDKKQITDFEVGTLVPGYIKDFQNYGCFVETANGFIGLCPKACLCDDFVSDPTDVFKANESVVCKVTNIDLEKGRFLVSLKGSDIEGNTVDQLSTLFVEWEKFGRQPAHTPGCLVTCEVTRVAKEGTFVSLTGSGVGFIPGTQEQHVGTEMEGVVLDYDAAQNIYSIGNGVEMVEGLKEEKKKKKVKVGEEVEGEIVLVTEEYFVVYVADKGHR
eukprot:sb/3466406/